MQGSTTSTTERFAPRQKDKKKKVDNQRKKSNRDARKNRHQEE
jgi:hypothetical protein